MVWNTRKRKYSKDDGYKTAKKTATAKKARITSSRSARSIDETSEPHPRLSLLGMPGEIRNLIFEFALTATHRQLLPYQDDDDDDDDDSYRPQVAAKRRYRHLWDGAKRMGKANLQPFNQLKYVCRQLHAETSDTELHYNVVCVDCLPNLEELISRCTARQYQWLKLSPPDLANHQLAVHLGIPETAIQKVYYMHYKMIEDMVPILGKRWINPINWDYLVFIADFCHRHPDISVRITFSDFAYPVASRDHPDFLEHFLATAMFISMVFRRVDLTHLLPKSIAKRRMKGFGRMTVQDVILDNGTNFGKTWPVPPEAVKEFEAENMRFYPMWWPEMGTVENAMSKIAADWVEAHKKEGWDAEHWRDICAKELRRWFGQGI